MQETMEGFRHCKTLGCKQEAKKGSDMCTACTALAKEFNRVVTATSGKPIDGTMHGNDIVSVQYRRRTDTKMSLLYPKYYKSVGDLTEVDVYAVCKVFQVDDHSGCVHHSIKKLLLPGTRTGGKSRYDDIKEARDTLTRWLELHAELAPKVAE